jgi:hypothetical protein
VRRGQPFEIHLDVIGILLAEHAQQPLDGSGRVVSGDCSPETPTEPDMQIFRIRLFGPRFRYATFAGRMRGSGNG